MHDGTHPDPRLPLPVHTNVREYEATDPTPERVSETERALRTGDRTEIERLLRGLDESLKAARGRAA